MEVSFKRSDTLTFIMMEKVLMVMVEVDVGLRSVSLPPIIHVCLVYLCVAGHQPFQCV